MPASIEPVSPERPSTQAALSVTAASASRTLQPYRRTARPIDERQRLQRRGAGVAVGRQHADRAGVGQGAARRHALVAEHLGAGQQHGRALGGRERREVVGMQAREVVDRPRARLQRHRDGAVRVELLDVRAQGHALARRDRAEALEVGVRERDRLDVDVERVDVALARERVDLVHPRRRPRSPAAPRGRRGR